MQLTLSASRVASALRLSSILLRRSRVSRGTFSTASSGFVFLSVRASWDSLTVFSCSEELLLGSGSGNVFALFAFISSAVSKAGSGGIALSSCCSSIDGCSGEAAAGGGGVPPKLIMSSSSPSSLSQRNKVFQRTSLQYVASTYSASCAGILKQVDFSTRST